MPAAPGPARPRRRVAVATEVDAAPDPGPSHRRSGPGRDPVLAVQPYRGRSTSSRGRTLTVAGWLTSDRTSAGRLASSSPST